MQFSKGESGVSLQFQHDTTQLTPAVRNRRQLLFLAKLFIVSLLALSPGTALADSQNGYTNTSMSKTLVTPVDNEQEIKPAPFYEALRKALKKRKTTVEKICPGSDPVARRILEEYGAIFLAVKKVLPPPACVFTAEEQVTIFQNEAGFVGETIADSEIELQEEAMKALRKAREDALKEQLDITPRGGTEAARRNYEDSMRLWDTRFLPALEYWQGQGRLTAEQVERLRGLTLHDQVAEVLELEKSGIFFSKDLSKSILYSIAAPGTSQHIAMLALDVTEFDNPRVREILANHGWFQTVLSDLPHFTFLGLKEKDLPKHGLKNVMADGQNFWIPNVS